MRPDEGAVMRDMEIKQREDRVRRKLAKQGLMLRKNRARTVGAHHLGGYRIVDNANHVMRGSDFELDLEAVEAFAAEQATQ